MSATGTASQMAAGTVGILNRKPPTASCQMSVSSCAGMKRPRVQFVMRTANQKVDGGNGVMRIKTKFACLSDSKPLNPLLNHDLMQLFSSRTP